MKHLLIIAMAIILVQCGGAAERSEDKSMDLNGIWVLESVKGQTVNLNDLSDPSKPPELEIVVGEMKYNGTDGCNNIFGGIDELKENTLKFGIGAGTRMMCPKMEIPDEFNQILPEVTSYKIEQMKLRLFDTEGEELMQFNRID
jgi:heat shock protein HslJ